MKIRPTSQTLTAFATLLLTTFSVRADQIASPDRKAGVVTGQSIRVVDASGKELVLDRDTTGMQRAQVSWSPDSRRVVVAENFGRGSGIFGAWRDGKSWHKAVQSDADAREVIRKAESLGGGRVVAEQRYVQDWINPDECTVIGTMTLSNGRKVAYTYKLRFTSGPVSLSKGGYEEGAIKGDDYWIPGT
jgi:hypothetical protein